MSRQAKAQGIIRRQIKFGEFHAEARRNGWILISDSRGKKSEAEQGKPECRRWWSSTFGITAPSGVHFGLSRPKKN
jgi:hypothetical protein